MQEDNIALTRVFLLRFDTLTRSDTRFFLLYARQRLLRMIINCIYISYNGKTRVSLRVKS